MNQHLITLKMWSPAWDDTAQTSVNIADEGSPSRKMAVPREKSSSQKSSGGLIVGEILLILAAMIGIGAIALFLFNLTGGGKYPILIWIICGLVFLFFNGSVETALVVAAVLAVVGVLCRASYYSSNNRSSPGTAKTNRT